MKIQLLQFIPQNKRMRHQDVKSELYYYAMTSVDHQRTGSSRFLFYPHNHSVKKKFTLTQKHNYGTITRSIRMVPTIRTQIIK